MSIEPENGEHELPSGTVTFLFTDVEWCAALWRRDREGMRAALAEHDRLLRGAVEAASGVIVKHTGDGVMAAFAAAPAALSAALRAQLALQGAAMEGEMRLPVRMGMHTGTSSPAGDDYFGPAPTKAARVMAMAHGGQVILSQAAAELARDELDQGVDLLDLGEHWLRDAEAPERLWQLTHPDLPTEFPPLRTSGRRQGGQAAAPLRVVVAEDAYLLRESIERLLGEYDDIEIAGVCADFDSLVEAVETERPDVLLTDIRMPPGGADEGIRAAELVRERSPETAVLVLSQYAEPRYALRLLEEGSERRGYLLKERVSDAEQLVSAIREVARGGSVIDPKLVNALVDARSAAERSSLNELTPREREVLAEMAQGKNNAAIAESLVLTERAVEKHVGSIFLKLDLRYEERLSRRVKAVLIYLSEAAG